MTSGKMVLILDGFDEVDVQYRTRITKDILSLSNTYPKIRIMASSRPDDTLDSWEEFVKYRVRPLTKEQALELITKLDYDEKTKSRFVDELQKGLYEQHQDFLSNPLLLTMMLLTYEQIAEIPSKMHIFYNQAFETLFNKHDALKSLYKRKTYTEMPIDDFKRVLSAFSMTSYTKRHVSFSRDDINVFFDSARKLTGIEFDNSQFLKDLLESVCILYKDGFYYTYTHRSFQEYFAAYFLSSFTSPRRTQILKRMIASSDRDNVLKLLFEMNPEAVEQDLIIPVIEQTLKESKSVKGGIYKYARILDLWYEGLSLIPGDQIGYRLSDDKPSSFLMIFIYKMYPNFAEQLQSWRQNKKDEEIEKKIIRQLFKKPNDRLVPFLPITKEKHDAFIKLGCKDYVEERLRISRQILSHFKKKYKDLEEDIDTLLLV